MNKLKYLIFLTTIGCTNIVGTKIVTCDKQSKDKDVIAQFILKCIENGNPKSDEEPEDWIYICEGMANRTYLTCKSENGFYWTGGIFFDYPPRRTYQRVLCSDAAYPEEIEYCKIITREVMEMEVENE